MDFERHCLRLQPAALIHFWKVEGEGYFKSNLKLGPCLFLFFLPTGLGANQDLIDYMMAQNKSDL